MPEVELRPEPEALLREVARDGRGRLKVFLGAAPGVGKTYAMLEAARARRKDGIDVVAAVIETHGRMETEALLRGLEIMPRRPVYYRDRILSEMDLDALLMRRPTLALIDELAHTNAPESRHEKRWQDVEEVLDAGIDVYTTLNVQHIETLNDTVARITGIRVRETVPDAVLQAADEIELVDLTPDELIDRLKAGKVYVPEQAARATQNFFAKGNLTALRELAMRAAADRVDADLRAHMAANAIPGPWPTQERILVCVTEDPSTRDAIRIAKRAADRARAEWIVLSLSSTRSEAQGNAAKDAVAASLRLAQRLGAEVATLSAEHDQAQEVLDFARRQNVRRIVIGRPPERAFWQAGRSLAATLLRQGGAFEITVTPLSNDAAAGRPRRWSILPRNLNPAGYLGAVVAVSIAVGCSFLAERLFPVASLSLIFMTAVITVASRSGMGPAALASLLGFLCYDFFFVEPRLTFTIYDRSELLTLSLFLAASLLTGNLAARLRARIAAQGAIADRTIKLFNFAGRAAAAAGFDDVVWASVSHVASTLEAETILLAPNAKGELAVVGGFPPEDHIDLRDLSAARFAWQSGEPTGHGSDTLPAARWLFLPVSTGNRTLAVLGVVFADEHRFASFDRRLLDALIDQIALALERTLLTEELSQTRLASETERLRTALLSSVSHDLRTPLVTIIGAAESLAETPSLSETARHDLALNIREEGERLDRYVQNLLDMTRLGHGALTPLTLPIDVTDLIGAARHRMRGVLRDHPVDVEIPEALPPVLADPVLTEQVLVNVLDNAAKYAPAGTSLRIVARQLGRSVELRIADGGPGIPEGDRDKIFDMFYRVETGDRQRAGTGLGLAISRGLIEAQGGSIRAEPALPDGSGTAILIRLPLAPPEILP